MVLGALTRRRREQHKLFRALDKAIGKNRQNLAAAWTAIENWIRNQAHVNWGKIAACIQALNEPDSEKLGTITQALKTSEMIWSHDRYGKCLQTH